MRLAPLTRIAEKRALARPTNAMLSGAYAPPHDTYTSPDVLSRAKVTDAPAAEKERNPARPSANPSASPMISAAQKARDTSTMSGAFHEAHDRFWARFARGHNAPATTATSPLKASSPRGANTPTAPPRARESYDPFAAPIAPLGDVDAEDSQSEYDPAADMGEEEYKSLFGEGDAGSFLSGVRDNALP